MPLPMPNYPARMIQVPADKIDDVMPKGDVIEIRRVYPAQMQPDTKAKWSRDFTKQRISRNGAYFCAPLKGCDPSKMTIGIPVEDGSFIFLLNEAGGVNG